jgi:hypothetical protein
MPVSQRVEITAPNIQKVQFTIRGSAPLVINRFSLKTREQIHNKQEAGTTSSIKKNRESKDFKLNYEQAKYISADGWCGIPATAFRNAMVSACRLVGFVMTRAKLSIFIEADGYDKEDMIPLVKITKGEPHYFESYVRLETGVCDLRARPMWNPNWEAIVTISFDADQMTLQDITNLMMRVGKQIGLCEGRPDSKKSCGQGWGLFELANDTKGKKK